MFQNDRFVIIIIQQTNKINKRTVPVVVLCSLVIGLQSIDTSPCTVGCRVALLQFRCVCVCMYGGGDNVVGAW